MPPARPVVLANIVIAVQVDDEAEATTEFLLRAAVIGRAPRLGEFVSRREGL
jgi:hypothetical protein